MVAAKTGEPVRWTRAIAGHDTKEPLIGEGLEIADSIRTSGGGRKMFLTFPFIEQDFTYFTNSAPLPRQIAISMYVKGISRQLT